MPRKPEDDIFEGLQLAPRGKPELLCRVCGGPKVPTQKCYQCWVTGRIYRKREITNPTTQLRIADKRRKKIQAYRKRYRVRHPKAVRWNRMRKRVFQVRELDRLLDAMFKCFERDDQGKWQLFQDRFEEFQEACYDIDLILPRIRQLQDYYHGYDKSYGTGDPLNRDDLRRGKSLKNPEQV